MNSGESVGDPLQAARTTPTEQPALHLELYLNSCHCTAPLHQRLFSFLSLSHGRTVFWQKDVRTDERTTEGKNEAHIARSPIRDNLRPAVVTWRSAGDGRAA